MTNQTHKEKMQEAKKIYFTEDFRAFMRKMQGLTDEDFQAPVPRIKEKILSATEKDPLEMFERIMREVESEWDRPSPLPVNSDWHHFIVPGVGGKLGFKIAFDQKNFGGLRRRINMKKLIILATAFVLAGAAGVAGQTFDQRVSEARRHMRVACQAVQQIVKTAVVERSGIKEAAAGEAAEAERLWTGLAKEYATAVPAGYAGDPGWAQRLEDVRLNIARMGKEISAGEWRPAFLSCAHACNLITTMHEANGVTLAIDAMSALRKKVGFARGLLAAGKPDKARALVKEILAARDAVLLTPGPVTSNREAYLGALPELSLAVDALAEAVRSGSDMKTALESLAALVERVYELAI